MVLAAALRVWELDHHLPYLPVPGEAKSLRVTLRMLTEGTLNPSFFHYPSLPFYAWLVSLWAWVEAALWADVFTQTTDVGAVRRIALGAARADQPGIVLVVRGWSVALGLTAVWATQRTGRVLFGRQGAGLCAGLLLALSPLHVVASHLARHDIWVVGFVALSLWASARVWRWGLPRDSLLAGVAAGLATASKYNGWVALVGLVAAHLVRDGRRGLTTRSLWRGVGAAGAAFLVTSPYVLLDFHTFWADFSYELAHYASDHAGRDDLGRAWYFTRLLTQETTTVVLAAGGVLVALWSRRPALLLTLAFPGIYLGLILPFEVQVERLLLPLLPPLALLGGWSLSTLWGQAAELPARWRRVLRLGLALTLWVPAARVHDEVTALARQDARDTSREWIRRNLPRGAHIALESYGPFISGHRFQVEQIDAGRGFSALWVHRPGWYRDQGFDYLVVSSGMSGRYLAGRGPSRAASRYRALFEEYPLVQEFHEGGRSVWIYGVE